MTRFWSKLETTLIVIISFTFIFFLAKSSPVYLDEKLYIECGLKLVNGSAPINCNLEHPPLGKYLIGLFFSLHIEWLFNYVFLTLTAISFFLLFSKVSEKAALFTLLFLSTDTLFLNVFKYYLLDPPALGFSALSLYLFALWFYRLERFRTKTFGGFSYLAASGAAAGASLACKWQTLPVLSIIPLYLLWLLSREAFSKGSNTNRKPSFYGLGLSVFLGVALLAYLSTFVSDALHYGVGSILAHNLRMVSYMGYRHSIFEPIALIGFIKLVTKAEYWFHPANMFIFISIITSSINGSLARIPIMVNSTCTWIGRHFVILYIGLGGIAWYLLFPSFLAYLWRGLANRLDSLRVFILIAAGLSLINVLYGPIDWYYVYTLPFLYFIMSDLILSSFKYGHTIVIAILVAQTAQFILSLLGLIPWSVSFNANF